MRTPDRETSVLIGNGLTALVSVWVDPTDLPWDGTEPLEENAEGYDLLVEASLSVLGQTFKAGSSLGSIWIMPDAMGRAFLDDEIKTVTDDAIASLKTEIQRVASGEDVASAQVRAKVARKLAL